VFSPLELLWLHTDRGGDCWLWQGAASKGYGRFTYLGVNRQAHRWVYEEAIGPIPRSAYSLQRCGNTCACGPTTCTRATMPRACASGTRLAELLAAQGTARRQYLENRLITRFCTGN
jgi:hypothetical protein